MRSRSVSKRIGAAAVPGFVFLLLGALARGEPPPRTLVLALDGVPYRVMQRAREAGAFEAWPATSRLIAPFPSMTNVSFTLVTQSLGVGPTAGYELRHYDWEHDVLTGGNPLRHAEHSQDWKLPFDVASRRLSQKLAVYTRPLHHVDRQLGEAERALADTGAEVVLVHVGATDALQHLDGDESTLRALLRIEEWIENTRDEHRRRHGRDLRVLLLSDHGNSCRKIRRVSGLRRLLRRAGLRPSKHLRRPDDVIVSTFGMAGYGALYTSAENAERAARAIAQADGVDLAAWRSGAAELRVLGHAGSAVIAWRKQREASGNSGLRFSYGAIEGDPLALASVRDSLEARGLLDEEGFADDELWLQASADGRYPDAMGRLLDGLTGAHVVNRATVLISMKPGRAWGWKTAAVFAWLRGGRLEGTHGGLDHDSSSGFLLASDPSLQPGSAVRMRDALSALALDERATASAQ